MQASPWDSDIPCRLKATWLLPASARTPLPSHSWASQGKPLPQQHVQCSSLWKRPSVQPESSPFSAKIWFPPTSATDESLSHSKQGHETELLAKDKSPAFIVIPVWLILAPFLGVWSHTGFPRRVWSQYTSTLLPQELFSTPKDTQISLTKTSSVNWGLIDCGPAVCCYFRFSPLSLVCVASSTETPRGVRLFRWWVAKHEEGKYFHILLFYFSHR